ncbi:MAG: DUF4221 family protein [Bacteroidota bacterium]
MKFVQVLFLLLFLTACQEDYSEALQQESIPPNVQFTNDFTLELTDSLSIPLPQGIPNYLGLTDVLSGDSLFYFKYASNKIAKVDIVNARVDSIILPPKIVTGNILSICVIGKDSILLTQDMPQSLILVKERKSAKIIYLPKINFTNDNEIFSKHTAALNDREGNFLLDYSSLAYDAKNKLVYLGLQAYDAYSFNGFENSERMATFDLATKEWKDIYAAPEGMLKLRADKTYGYLMSQKKMLLKGDTVFANYTNDHHIYYYQKGQPLGKFPHVSSQSKKLFLPMDAEAAEDVETLKKYTHAAPSYSSFYYHEKLKLYSRLYFDQQEPFDASGKYKPRNLWRDVYVTFLNEQFEHVGEFKFPNGSVPFNGAKPLADGFLLFDVRQKTADQLGLKYVYTIKPVDHQTSMIYE